MAAIEMDQEPSTLSAWQEIGAVPVVASAQPSMPASISSRMADHTDLVPVDRKEFAAELVPCLALVSGVGMKQEDRREWLNAAYKALDGIPIALLKRGAQAAMATADHPSKIVPAIMAAIRDDWDGRKRLARPAAILPPSHRIVETKDSYCTPEEAAAILKKAGFSTGMQRQAAFARSGDGPRKPTREDYIRMGVDPAVLDAMAAEKVEAGDEQR